MSSPAAISARSVSRRELQVGASPRSGFDPCCVDASSVPVQCLAPSSTNFNAFVTKALTGGPENAWNCLPRHTVFSEYSRRPDVRITYYPNDASGRDPPPCIPQSDYQRALEFGPKKASTHPRALVSVTIRHHILYLDETLMHMVDDGPMSARKRIRLLEAWYLTQCL